MSTVEEARRILAALEFDTKRTNEMAGRTLMALAGVDENTPWSEATGERLGVRAIMDWMRERLGRERSDPPDPPRRRQIPRAAPGALNPPSR